MDVWDIFLVRNVNKQILKHKPLVQTSDEQTRGVLTFKVPHKRDKFWGQKTRHGNKSSLFPTNIYKHYPQIKSLGFHSQHHISSQVDQIQLLFFFSPK